MGLELGLETGDREPETGEWGMGEEEEESCRGRGSRG
jgi:hypothetical protein